MQVTSSAWKMIIQSFEETVSSLIIDYIITEFLWTNAPVSRDLSVFHSLLLTIFEMISEDLKCFLNPFD